MIDIPEHINATERHVGVRTLSDGEASVVTVSRVFAAEVEDVWDACTNVERIPRWLMPITGDLRLGGTYQLEGNAGGTVERCDPPTSFGATWEFGGEVSWIEVRLRTEADGTRLTVEHIALVDADRWDQFGPGAVGVGWDMMLAGLNVHLSTRQAVDPAEAAAWAASDEGRAFMTGSSEAWRDASIAAGTDRDRATASAERTTAFYTGQDVSEPSSAS
jgi:uncharacterized protein YndB with AHSA1/START domain